MIQTLNNYGYDESVYMKPKGQYKVTISSEDHIITIEDGGALLARLGLELVDSTLYLKGYDNVIIAQTDIPLSTGINNITYDKQKHVITFEIIKIDGSIEKYDIDISDLVDLYQSGNGIEITEDEEGNKTISVKIEEDSKNILSADEDGLAIDLSEYLTKDSMESISGLVETEKERAEGVEGELRDLIKAEKDRATAKEDSLAQNIVDTNANVAQCINQLNTNIAKIVGDLNGAIFEESQRAITKEKALNDEILKCITKEEADARYALKSDLSSITETVDSLSATTNELSGKIDTAIANAEDEHRKINDAISGLQTADEQQWAAITTHTNAIDGINTAIGGLQTADEQQWAMINNKVDKEEGKGLSSNDFTDTEKEKLDNIDIDAIYTAIASGDTILDLKISAVSAATDKKVETTVYEEKVAEIEENADRIESLIPSLDGYATEEWVEEKGYITDVALQPYSTTSEMQRICVTEEEWTNERKPALLNEIDTTYAKKTDIPSLNGYATEEWVEGKNYIDATALDDYYTTEQIDAFNQTFATKTDLANGLAKKIDANGATDIAKEIVDNKLTAYSPTTSITKMIEDGVAEGVEKAIESGKSYTDGIIISAKTEMEEYTDKEVSKNSSAITHNANELHVLSVCNDGDEYNITKAMSAQGTGVVDETYRLVHKLLEGLNENDLSKLNTELKKLINN